MNNQIKEMENLVYKEGFHKSQSTNKTKDCTTLIEEKSVTSNLENNFLGKKQDFVKSELNFEVDKKAKGEKKNRGICNVCKNGGELLLCDRCPKSFHKECIYLKEIDENKNWYCAECQEKIENINKRKEEKKSLPKKTNDSASNNIININFIYNNSTGENHQQQTQQTLLSTLNFFNNNSNKKLSSQPVESSKNKDRSKLKKIKSTKSFSSPNSKKSGKSKRKVIKKSNKEKPDKEKVELDISKVNYKEFNGNRLKEGEAIEEFENKTFQELNNIDFIIKDVLKKDKISNYVVSFLKKADEEKNPLDYKPKQSAKKKRPRPSVSKKKKSSSISTENDTKKKNKLHQTFLNEEAFKKGRTTSNNERSKKMLLEKQKKEKELKIAKEAELRKKAEELKKKEEEKKYTNARFPIEDSELFSKWDKYRLEEKYLNKPKPSPILIKHSYFCKVLKIYDFAQSFHEILKISNDFSMEMLYYSLISKEFPRINLMKEIIYSLVSILLDELIQEDTDDLDFENDDKDNILLKLIFRYSHQKRENIFNFSLIEILKVFVFSPKFELLVNDEVKELVKTKFHEFQCMDDFYSMLNLDEKILIIDFLINNCFELEVIREKLNRDILEKVDLKREKVNLEIELKNYENKKKEL